MVGQKEQSAYMFLNGAFLLAPPSHVGLEAKAGEVLQFPATCCGALATGANNQS
jgi:hypothetical protein